ncbi:MAG: GNAT family N-acetyltransferase [Victivallaceae bacterium]|nr:GNAT family N-acetyltransferase [Victivallaceae bacterium]
MMLDGKNSSVQWQRSVSDVLVLPVGAFEQHGEHLPLCCDAVFAKYIARKVAERFDACLLPVISIASSLEHTGFRGSFSLRPETLMQIIRDIANEAETQNFRYLLVVSTHGGNFPLAPVIRDINRQDRELKLIFVDMAAYFCRRFENGVEPELHAGEMEISFLRLMAPEMMKDPLPVPENFGVISPGMQRSDLNTFGIGHLNSDGVVGSAKGYSLEDAKKDLDAYFEQTFSNIKRTMTLLEKSRRYAGHGGQLIRPMHPKDISQLLRLTRHSNWNQLAGDWNFFISEYGDKAFVMVHNGRVIASGTGINYHDEVSWIGMILVDGEFRRMGIATCMMNTLIDSLEREAACIKLDATPAGKTVYDKLGFKDECVLRRMYLPLATVSDVAGPAGISIIPATEADNNAIIEYDASVFEAKREKLMARLLHDGQEFSFKAERNGELLGFVTGRRGFDYVQIGPLEAENDEIALSLLKMALKQLHGSAILLDCFESNVELVKKFEELGFMNQRIFIRMCRGEYLAATDYRKYPVIAGPEFG